MFFPPKSAGIAVQHIEPKSCEPLAAPRRRHMPLPRGKVTRFRACADSIFKQRCLRIKHRDLAARCARVLQNCFALSENRGRRECRMPNAPAASCVKKQTHELVTTVTPDSTRHSPRNGFTAYFALSPVTRLV